MMVLLWIAEGNALQPIRLLETKATSLPEVVAFYLSSLNLPVLLWHSSTR